MKNRETRILKAELKIEKREDGQDVIKGYSAVFNKWSERLGWFKEQIAPGAFTAALKRSDPRSLFNHDPNLILGRKSAGTLIITQDDTGLFMDTIPPDTSYARDLLVSIGRKDIREQSFGFTVLSDTWEDMDKEVAKRTINEIGELFDVSPVTFAAYPDTSVALRSYNELKNSTGRGDKKGGRSQILAMDRMKENYYKSRGWINV